ncbi:MAG: hypothetical protein ACJAVJ_001102 [Planctomycetota bacterium]|jgi:hypothetical protein
MKKNYLALGLMLLSPALLAQEPQPKPTVQEGPAPKTETPKQEPTTKSEADVKSEPDLESEAQEEGERPKAPLVPPGLGKREQDGAEKIVELFKDVDAKMKAIDAMLFDIGAGEVPLTLPKDSGLGDLLDLTRSASNDVVKDIDEILKIAEEMAKSQSKPGGKGPPKPGQQGQGKPEKKEGEAGKQPKPGEEPGEEEGEKPGEKPGEKGKPEQEGGKDPKSGKESEQPAQNKPGSEGPSDGSIGPGSKANLSERWGELPERTRETFRNQGGEDVPLFYRDWIESYYRHLNRSDSTGN